MAFSTRLFTATRSVVRPCAGGNANMMMRTAMPALNRRMMSSLLSSNTLQLARASLLPPSSRSLLVSTTVSVEASAAVVDETTTISTAFSLLPRIGALSFPQFSQRRWKARGNTYQPRTFKRKRRFGYLVRARSRTGRRILAARKLKGRWYLSH
ncbi:mitochondrial 54S ribosomal protein bL34m [Limtongia smithiae]|uniref:mitochondrial 54S ribosomal protein bL34m n=1 Tax=Limtongia smithiae TaxID=1125753 RepID=UPI0034CEAF64